MSKDIIIVADYTEETSFTADELCERLHIEAMTLTKFVSYDIVIPRGQKNSQWVFDLEQVTRLQKALRLQRAFELNHEGVALVLQLLDEIDMLRAESDLLNKHILK